MYNITPAIALHNQSYNEHGILATLYAQEEGLIRCITKSNRTPRGKQRYAALLHPMALVNVQYTPARREEGLHTLREVEVQQPLPRLVNEPIRIFIALFCSEILATQLVNHPSSPQIYQLAKQTALATDDPQGHLAWLPAWFLLRLACLLGYTPSGVWSQKNCHFDPENGTFSDIPYGVSPDESYAIAKLLEATKIPSRDTIDRLLDRGTLINTLLHYLEWHNGIPCNPKSIGVIKGLLS